MKKMFYYYLLGSKVRHNHNIFVPYVMYGHNQYFIVLLKKVN